MPLYFVFPPKKDEFHNPIKKSFKFHYSQKCLDFYIEEACKIQYQTVQFLKCHKLNLILNNRLEKTASSIFEWHILINVQKGNE